MLYKPINSAVTKKRVENLLMSMDSVHLAERNRNMERELREADTDVISGIYNKNAFLRHTAQYLAAHPEGDYILTRWDIDNFKIYNDIYGTEAGDRFLRRIGDYYREHSSEMPGLIYYAHYEADHFVCFFSAAGFDPESIYDGFASYVSGLRDRPFDISPRIGLYRVDDPKLDVAIMCDRAYLALQSIKKSYGKRSAWYENSMRDAILFEHDIVNQMKPALEKGQFHIFFQPQFNYATGALIGAEALVRWIHPEKGFISPGVFIPIFESNGFIYELDSYVWEQTCAYIKRWKDMNIYLPPISVSVNISRRDLYKPDIVERICALCVKYGLDTNELNLEITESAYIDNPQQLINVVNQLREHGFRVEMDDFGSGYSSLNTLKNVPVDSLKLDMNFLSRDAEGGKGGKILSSVVRMAHEINLPVIAEGVETKQHADYLKSIGCYYMQGYYFSRPVPADRFEELLQKSVVSDIELYDKTIGIDGAADFMDANTQTTLLFNSFVGGAAILEYHAGNAAIKRVNDKFAETLGISPEKYSPFRYSILDGLTPKSREAFIAALENAIKTGGESECEIYSPISEIPPAGKSDVSIADSRRGLWLLCRLRCLTRNVESYIFYLSVENITRRRELEENDRMYRNITRNLPVGTAVYNIDGESCHMLFANERFCDIFGYSRGEYESCLAAGGALEQPVKIADLPPDIREKLANGEPVELPRIYASKKDGTGFWLSVRLRMIKNPDNTEVVYAAFSDVTESFESRCKSETVEASIPGGILRFSASDGSIYGISDALLDMLGFTREEFTERFHNNIRELIPREDRDGIWSLIQKQINGEAKAESLECRLIGASGEPKWFSTAGRVLPDPNGNLCCVVVALDIDRQKRLEQELLRGKIELENIVNSIPGGVAAYSVQPDGFHLIYFSPGVAALTERTEEEYRKLLETSKGRGIIYPEDEESTLKAVNEAIESRRNVDINYRVPKKNGAYIWVNLRGRVAYEENGYPVFCAVFHNLSAATGLYRRLLDEINDPLIVADRSTHELLYVNEAAAKLAGRPRNEFVGKKCYEFLKNSDTPCSDCFTEKLDGLPLEPEIDIRGHRYASRITRVNWNGRDAYINYIAGRSDARVCKNELDDILGHIPAGLVVLRVENERFICEYASEKGTPALICPSGEETDIAGPNGNICPDALPALLEGLKGAAERKQPVDLNFRVSDGDGSPRPVNLRAAPVVSDDGTLRFFGIYSEGEKSISEIAPEAMKRQLEYDRFINSFMPGLIVLRPLGQKEGVYMAGGLPELCGYTQQEIRGLFEGDISVIGYKEDAAALKARIAEIRATKPETYQDEYRIKTKDGDMRWITGRGSHFVAPNGFAGYIHIFTDTTGLHELLDELHKRQIILNHVVTQSDCIFYYYDIEKQTCTALDGEKCRAAGLDENINSIPEKISNGGIVYEDSLCALRKFIALARQGAPSAELKIHLRTAGGDEKWFELRRSPIKDNREFLNGALLSLLDITVEHEREIVYARYLQSIDAAEKSNGIFFETDLTANVIEKAGGMLLNNPSSFINMPHDDAVGKMLAVSVLGDKENTEIAHNCSRERLLMNYADGLNNVSYDVPVAGKEPSDSRWMRINAQLTEDLYSGHIRLFTQITEITAEKEEQIRIKLQTELDGMTGVYNHTAVERIINERLASGGSEVSALIFIDLDDLKKINDSCGHPQGDRAIIATADTLRRHFRKTDVIGRIGGEEFVVLLPGMSDKAALSASLAALLVEFSDIRIGEKNDRAIHCSIGCTFCSAAEKDDFSTSYKRADIAMYHVKHANKNDYAFYTPEMRGESYIFSGHSPSSAANPSAMAPGEAERLIGELARYYTLALSVNLTKNKYKLIKAPKNMTSLPSSGSVDKFTDAYSGGFDGEARENIRSRLSRKALLTVYSEGKPDARLFVPSADGEGTEIAALFYKNSDGGICCYIFARPSDKAE